MYNSRKNYLANIAKILTLIMLVGLIALPTMLSVQTLTVQAQSQQGTRVFTDSLGREVTIPQNIERIVPAGKLSQALMYTLAPEKLAGLAEPFPKGMSASADPALMNLPVFGDLEDSNLDVDIQALLASNPQLIIFSGERDDDLRAKIRTIESLLQVPVVFLEFSVTATEDSLNKVEELLGSSERLNRIKAQSKDILDRTESTRAEFALSEKEPLTVYWAKGKDGKMTIPPNSEKNALLEMVPLKNVLGSSSDVADLNTHLANMDKNFADIARQGAELGLDESYLQRLEESQNILNQRLAGLNERLDSLGEDEAGRVKIYRDELRDEIRDLEGELNEYLYDLQVPNDDKYDDDIFEAIVDVIEEITAINQDIDRRTLGVYGDDDDDLYDDYDDLVDVDFDDLLELDPDIILVDNPHALKAMRDSDEWKQLKAFANDDVFLVPNVPQSILTTSNSPTSLIGLEWLGKVAYPEHYQEPYGRHMAALYNDFFGVDLAQDDLARKTLALPFRDLDDLDDLFEDYYGFDNYYDDFDDYLDDLEDYYENLYGDDRFEDYFGDRDDDDDDWDDDWDDWDDDDDDDWDDDWDDWDDDDDDDDWDDDWDDDDDDDDWDD